MEWHLGKKKKEKLKVEVEGYLQSVSCRIHSCVQDSNYDSSAVIFVVFLEKGESLGFLLKKKKEEEEKKEKRKEKEKKKKRKRKEKEKKKKRRKEEKKKRSDSFQKSLFEL